MLAAGHSLAFIDRIELIAPIIAHFEEGMGQALARLAVNHCARLKRDTNHAGGPGKATKLS
jgi:hypothetical protein